MMVGNPNQGRNTTLEITNLTILPSRGAKPDFAGKVPSEAEFEPKAPGAKGLAPPGPEPPPKAHQKPLGEEGAIREPNAPTQNLDFSPKLFPNSHADTAEEIGFELGTAFPAEDAKPTPFPKEYAPGFSLAAIAVMGPIVVPSETADAMPIFEAAFRPGAEIEEALPTMPASKPGFALAVPNPEGKFASADPGKLVADICPAHEPATRGDGTQGKPSVRNSSEELPIRSREEASPAEAPEVLPTRGERMAKLTSSDEELARVLKVHTEDSPVPIPQVPSRAEALKMRLADPANESSAAGEALSAKAKAADPEGPIAEISAVPQGEKVSPRTKSAAGDDSPMPKENGGKPVDKSQFEDEPAWVSAQNETDGALPVRTKSSKRNILIDPKLDPLTMKADAPAPVGAPAGPEKSPTVVKETAKPVPDLSVAQRESVIRQVVDRVESLAASNPRQNVTIHLDPKDFGSITLIVKRSGSEVDAEFYASHDAVRQALETNKSGLQSGLEQRGVQLNSMTVGSELSHGSGRQEQAARDAAEAHRQFMPRPERSEAPTHSLEAMRHLTRRVTGVDLWI